MREFIFFLLLFVLHQSTGGFIDLGEQCVPGNTNYDWDLCNYDYQKLDFDWFNVRISKINSPSNEKPRNISAKIEIPVSRKFIQFVLNENSKFRYLEEADFIELRLEVIGTSSVDVIGTSSVDFSIKVDPRVVYQSHAQYLPEPWQFKYKGLHTVMYNISDLGIVFSPDRKNVEAKFGFLQLYFQQVESVRNSDSDWAERMKYKIRFGDIEHELLLVRNATYTTRKPKLENLSRNALGTYTKRRITDENGSFSQLMTVRVNFVNTNSEVFIQEFSFLILPFLLTLYKSTGNITRTSGSREDGMEVSGVIVKDNEWVSHGKMTATHPSFAQEEVVNFVYNKTRECCQGLNRSYHFETTENFLDVRPFKVDLIRTERRDSLDKLESITFKLYISLMDLTFVLILEPRKKVHSNHASPNGNSNDECKIEASSSLFRYQLEPEPSSRIPCWDKASFTVEKNGLKQISSKHEFLGNKKQLFADTETFIYKTRISFDDISTIRQQLCGFSAHLCFQNLDFSFVHYDSGKTIEIFSRLTKDEEDLFNLSFGYTYLPFFHFNSSYIIPLFKYLTSSSSVPMAPFSLNFDAHKNHTYIDIAEIGSNKIWATLISGNDFDLWNERDGNVSKLMKFEILSSDGKSITGVMFDTSDRNSNHGYTKIGFDTFTNTYDVKLFLELSSDQFNLETNLKIENIDKINRSFQLNVLNDGKNGTWEIKYPEY